MLIWADRAWFLMPLSRGASGSLFGYSLACRDQNGDLRDDLLVGAPTANGNGLAQSGAVFLYQGGPNGLGTTPVWSAGGGQANEAFGYSIAMGDMDGDTRADIMLGAPYHNSPTQNLGGIGIENGSCVNVQSVRYSPQ